MNDFITSSERLAFPNKREQLLKDFLWMLMWVGMFVYYVFDLTN